MARRSIFNDPSPANSDNSEQDPNEHHSGYSDPSASDSSDESKNPPSDDEPADELGEGEVDDDDDELEDDGSEDERYRVGDHEDNLTSIKPYLGVLVGLERDHHSSLSRHLYSAHLLKRQSARRVAPPHTDSDSDNRSTESRPKKRPRHAELIPDSEEDDDKHLFGRGKRFITNQWTSWPHPSSYVPREAEHKFSQLKSQPPKKAIDHNTYEKPLKPKPPPAPSQMLTETLTATFLKIAKDKLRSRPAEEIRGMTPALDDDVSEHMLKPIVNHVISQLDGLLVGLYHERGYAKTLAGEVVKSNTRYMRGKATGVAWAQRKLRRAVTPTTDTEDENQDSAEECDPENDDGEGTPPKKAQKSKRARRRYPAPPPLAKKYALKRLKRLGVRDWSQVLGIAALSGWEEDVLQRTVKRCEGHFGQTMSWRRLKEGSDVKNKTESDEIWTGARLKHFSEDEDEDGVSRDGFMKPITLSCIHQGDRVRYLIKGPPKKRKSKAKWRTK